MINILGFSFVGGLVGLWVRHYCQSFSFRLAQQIYQTYIEIFPDNPPHFYPENCSFSPIKCGHFMRYFSYFALIFGGLYYFCSDWRLATIYGIYISLLCCISIIDWNYRLISPILCQCLIILAIFSAWLAISPLSIEQCLTSISIGFLIFYAIYHLAKWHYKQEALGRGDYWLMAGLSGFVEWQYFSLLVLLACLLAISYVLSRKIVGKKIDTIPFAPFLSIAGSGVCYLNLLKITLF